MFKLEKNLTQLTEAIKNQLPIVCTQNGGWYIQGAIAGVLRKFFYLEHNAKKALARAFNKILENLENYPIYFNEKNSQKRFFSSYIDCAQALITSMQKSSSHKSEEFNLLNRNMIALQYRIEEFNGGLDKIPSKPDLVKQLEDLVREWKSHQEIIYDKAVTQSDKNKIEEACQYPEFVKLLFKDEKLKISFMNWAIRDKISVAPFIEFPAMQRKIVESALNGRIGRMGGTSLKISKENQSQDIIKVLTLPIEGRPINILDEFKIITFRGNYSLSIRQIFDSFKNKYKEVGNIEFMSDGIINWNAHLLGWWDADKNDYNIINLKQNAWWLQLPIFEIINKKEAHNRYGWHLDGKLWNAAATASRESASLDFERTHAYLEIAIPMDNDHYAIYDFGKFAIKFPTSFFENLKIFCHNVHATIAYPDENVFFSHRQHANHSFPMTPEEGFHLMRIIKTDIINSMEKNFVFQIESENCAKWSQESLEKVLGSHRVPNLFKMSLLHTEPVGLVENIFGMIRKLPKTLQTRVLTALHIPFGATRGIWIVENGKKVYKSLNSHPFWETAEVYLPAFLHKQKENGAFTDAKGMPGISNNHAHAVDLALQQPLTEAWNYIKTEFSHASTSMVTPSGHNIAVSSIEKFPMPIRDLQDEVELKKKHKVKIAI